MVKAFSSSKTEMYTKAITKTEAPKVSVSITGRMDQSTKATLFKGCAKEKATGLAPRVTTTKETSKTIKRTVLEYLNGRMETNTKGSL